MKNITLDESRVYTENGKVKIKHLLLESANIDMSPHPTESRIFVKDGEVITILSEEIKQRGYLTLEETKQLIMAEVDTLQQQYDND